MIKNIGVFDVQFDAQITGRNPLPLFDNLAGGTLKKSAGTGTAQFAFTILNNLGTVEVDSGALAITAENAVEQVSNNALIAGTWKVRNGSTLDFSDVANVITNDADVTLSGPGHNVGAIKNLSSNSGNFTLLDGATFTAAGPLTNTGTLTLGAATELTVNGAYSQNASGSLNVQLGGSPSSGQFGRLLSTAAAAIDGTLALGLADGFAPNSGDTYSVVTAGAISGNFAQIDRLSPGPGKTLGVQVNATAVLVAGTVNPIDLDVGSVIAPGTGVPGQLATFSYTVKNLSATTAIPTTWTDSVFASPADVFSPSAVLIGRVTHQGGVAGNGQYSGVLTAPLPGLDPGVYHVFVVSDSRQLLPDPNTASNVGTSEQLMTVSFPTLTLGSPLSGTIDNGQDASTSWSLPAATTVSIAAQFVGAAGGEVYIAHQYVPSPTTFDESSADPRRMGQQVLIAGAQGGTYFVLVHGREASSGGKPFTLSATVLPLQVTSISPNHGSNLGLTTITVHSTLFSGGTTVTLVPGSGGTPIAASQVTIEDSATLLRAI